ncbi:uncharacterized protein LOC112566854 [Pomacea canaliculata]|uniref:uncharacterized protein LOC112566854 n=1 Tax=Pomacea canaliculata TaxID=400727 RepID=UPI000D72A5F7|nr:uncharacterized protein LOC112566854 [Pomacea canaliculata]
MYSSVLITIFANANDLAQKDLTSTTATECNLLGNGMPEENHLGLLTKICELAQKSLTSTNGKKANLLGKVVTASALMLDKPSGGVSKLLVGGGWMLSNTGKVVDCCMAYPEQLSLCLTEAEENVNPLFIENQVAEFTKLMTSNRLEIVKAVFSLKEGYTIMKEGVNVITKIGFKEAGKLLLFEGIPTIGKLALKMQFKQLFRLGLRALPQLFVPCVGGIPGICLELLASYFEVDKYISSWVGDLGDKIGSGITSWLRSIW